MPYNSKDFEIAGRFDIRGRRPRSVEFLKSNGLEIGFFLIFS